MAGTSLTPNNDSTVLLTAVVSATATSIVAVTGLAGTRIRVYKLFLVVGGTTNLTFEDASTALSGALPMVANGSITLDMDGTPWFSCGAGNNFTIGSSGSAIQVSGTIYYTQAQY